MFTLDMLEVLLPLASFSAAREHSMLAFPWPMASPCPLSLPLFPSAHPLAKCCGKLCVFFHVFISRLSFWFFFFLFFAVFCVFFCVFLAHFTACLFAQSFVLAVSSLCPARLWLWLQQQHQHQLGLSCCSASAGSTYLAHSAHVCVGRRVVCFILFAFVYK